MEWEKRPGGLSRQCDENEIAVQKFLGNDSAESFGLPRGIKKEFRDRLKKRKKSGSGSKRRKSSGYSDTYGEKASVVGTVMRIAIPSLAFVIGQVLLYVLYFTLGRVLLLDLFFDDISVFALIPASVCCAAAALFTVLGALRMRKYGRKGLSAAYIAVSGVCIAAAPAFLGYIAAAGCVASFVSALNDGARMQPLIAASAAYVLGQSAMWLTYFARGRALLLDSLGGVTSGWAVLAASTLIGFGSLGALCRSVTLCAENNGYKSRRSRSRYYSSDSEKTLPCGKILGMLLPFVVVQIAAPFVGSFATFVYTMIICRIEEDEAGTGVRLGFYMLMAATGMLIFVPAIPLWAVLLGNLAETIILVFAIDNDPDYVGIPVSFVFFCGMLVAACIFPGLVMPNIREMQTMADAGEIDPAYVAQVIADARVSMISGSVLTIIVAIVLVAMGINGTAFPAIGCAVIGFLLVNFTLDMPNDGWESVYFASDWAVLKGLLFTVPGGIYQGAAGVISEKIL